MFKRVFLTFVAALMAFPAVSQTCGNADLIEALTEQERARLDALVAPHPYPEGNLWKAEKPGSTVTVVGTLHIPDPRLQPLVKKVRPYLDSADLLILEATSDDQMGLQAMAMRNPELFFITTGPTLIDLLGDDVWAEAKARFEALGVPGVMAAKFQPWYASLTLSLAPCAMQVIQSGEKGFDRQLEDRAKRRSVPIATLDDPEQLLAMFTGADQAQQLEYLRLSLETTTDTAAAMSTLMKAYFEGRVREAWEHSRILIDQLDIPDGEEIFDEVNQVILVDRNKSWEPKIASLVSGKNVVLAVGAAHLSGETGVLRALERAGYKISPL